MFLLVPVHPGCPRQSLESRKMVVVVVVVVYHIDSLVKLSVEVLAWLSVWSEVQMIYICSS